MRNNYIKSIALYGLREFETDDCQLSVIMNEQGLKPDADLCLHSYIPFAKFVKIIETAAARWNRPMLGFEWGRATNENFPGASGLLILAKFSKNLRELANKLVRIMLFHTNGHVLKFVESENSPHIHIQHIYQGNQSVSRHLSEMSLVNLLQGIRMATDKSDLSPICAKLSCNDQTSKTVLQDFMGCPVHYGARYDELVFDKSVIEMRLNRDMSILREFFNKHVQKRLLLNSNFLQKTSVVIKEAVSMCWGTGIIGFKHVAHLFGIHQKSLQRMLNYENENFKTLLLDARIERAKVLLQETNLPVSMIAESLNYSGIPQFSSCFRRETGISPLSFRKQSQMISISDGVAN